MGEDTEDLNTWTEKVRKRKIIIIKKNSNRKDYGQARPISLLTGFYKIMSKIVNIQLTSTLENNSIFPNSILAFRKGLDPVRALRFMNNTRDLII